MEGGKDSFEPSACQSDTLGALYEKMSESSIPPPATPPQSGGKPTAQVVEKLNLWTL